MKDGLDRKIEIKAYQREQQIILEILDNGIGIPKSDLKRVFKKHLLVKMEERFLVQLVWVYIL